MLPFVTHFICGEMVDFSSNWHTVHTATPPPTLPRGSGKAYKNAEEGDGLKSQKWEVGGKIVSFEQFHFSWDVWLSFINEDNRLKEKKKIR